MKSVLRYTAAGLALATVGFASNASAATGSATARAEILSNLTVTVASSDATLNFGQITDNGVVGTSTVTVSPVDVRTCGANLTCGTGVTPNAPTFNVTGFANQSVAVTFPNASEPLDRVGGNLGSMPSQMTVGAFVSSASSVTLSALGAGSFSVGGTLTVNAGQAPGVYAGTVAVQVEYN
jgi:hypothetical protein